MRYVDYILIATNFYASIRFLLNGFGVLQSSKYSTTSNLVMGTLLLIFAAISAYVLITRKNTSLAFWMSLAPWLITLVILLFNMLFSDYK